MTTDVNEIVFVVAEDEYGSGSLDGVEPVIDDLSLVDIVKHAEGEISYLGLVPADMFLAAWAEAAAEEQSRRLPVLGCVCGVSECSAVIATMQTSPDRIVWSEFHPSVAVEDESPAAYGGIGPFMFDRGQFQAALGAPVRRDRPLRQMPDLEALSTGLPNDHVAWLRAMTMAFGRDFTTPLAPAEVQAVVENGLKAFAARGQPMTKDAVIAWARDRRFAEPWPDRLADRLVRPTA